VKPLKGVTVLDISRLLPGGFASLLLGDLGARIIKVEQPGVGDYYRAILKGSPLLGDQADIINQGKESLTLDLKNPEGRGIFLKLVRKADVVLENFRPGVLKKLSLDYLRLKKINPRVILCSVTGLGQKGPDASLAGHDLNYLGLSGLLSRNRDAGGRMVIPDFQVIDLAAGYDAAFKIAAAQAFKKCVDQARPVLLEPVVDLTVTVPEQYVGDVMGDLNTRRARVLGMFPQDDGLSVIQAQAPLAEVQRYATDLRSLTQGRGTYTAKLASYEEVPAHVAQSIIAEAKKERSNHGE